VRPSVILQISLFCEQALVASSGQRREVGYDPPQRKSKRFDNRWHRLSCVVSLFIRSPLLIGVKQRLQPTRAHSSIPTITMM